LAKGSATLGSCSARRMKRTLADPLDDPVSLFRWALFTKKRVRFHFVVQFIFERLVHLGRHKKISPLSVRNMSHLFGKVLSLL
jgi:hypothetical protein